MNGKTLDVQSNNVVVHGVTATKGAPATTVSWEKVSLGSAELVVGSSTLPITPDTLQTTHGVGGAITAAFSAQGTFAGGWTSTPPATSSLSVAFQGGSVQRRTGRDVALGVAILIGGFVYMGGLIECRR